MWSRVRRTVRGWMRRLAPSESRAVSFGDVWARGDVLSGGQDRALQLAAVYGAVRLLATNIASMPLHTFRDTPDGQKRISDSAVVRHPAAHGTRFGWIHRMVTSLALRGNAYGLVTTRDRNLVPTQIEWLHPDDVQIVDNRAVTNPQWWVLGRAIDRRDLVHIPYFTLPGQILGLSVITSFRTLFDAGHQATAFGADWFANGSVPSGVLESEQQISEAQAAMIKSRFRAAAEGRAPVVLGNGASYKPISVTPEESQFLESIQANASQIATVFGVPPEMIGGQSGGSLTYNTIEQQAINFVTFSLLPYVTLIEESLSGLLPPREYVRFNVDALIRSSTLDRYKAHSLAVGSWKTPNEIRKLENLPPIPSGDTILPPRVPTQQGVVDDD